MLNLFPALRISLCPEAVGLRKSFDGLAALVRQSLSRDPPPGHRFVFRAAAAATRSAAWQVFT